MKNILTLLLVVLSASVFAAKQEYGSVLVDEVTSIYDADTFRINIKDYPPIAGEHIPVRVLGIDAPEIRGKCQKEKLLARKAKQFTVGKLRNAKLIELRNIKRGKYFRVLAYVFVDGMSLGDLLIKSGLARTYDGGKRLGWCERF